METIYDHNPTAEELKNRGYDVFSKEWYLNNACEETIWIDLAMLFRERGNTKSEMLAWDNIPYRRDEFLRGFDVIELD